MYRLTILLVPFFIVTYSDLALGGSCFAGRFISITTNGKTCDTFGITANEKQVWNKCIKIKDGVPMVDVNPDFNQVNKLKTTFGVLDSFTYNNQTIGCGQVGRNGKELKCLSPLKSNDSQIVNCSPFMALKRPPLIVCVDKIDGTNYTIVSYVKTNTSCVLALIEESSGKISPLLTDTCEHETIFYLGVSKNGLHTFGLAKSNFTYIIYELDAAMEKITIIDIRLSDHLFGCSQKMCLEGDIDSIYDIAYGDSNDSKIYFARKTTLYKLNKMNEQIEDIVDTVGNMNEYAADTAFVTYPMMNGSRKPQVNFVSNGISYHIEDNKVISRYKIQLNVFAILQIDIKNYYFFVDDEIFEYELIDGINGGRYKLELVKKSLTKYRFYRLWKRFDAAYKDRNNIIYFFNKDYNVRYQWKKDGIMTPLDLPRLNQKTFWTCIQPEIYQPLVSKAFGLKSLNEYYKQIAEKYRYILLENDYDIPNAQQPESNKTVANAVTTKTQAGRKPLGGTPGWLIGVIAALVIIILIIIISICCIFRSTPKKRNKYSVASTPSATKISAPRKMESVKSRTKDEDSFASKSTIRSKDGTNSNLKSVRTPIRNAKK